MFNLIKKDILVQKKSIYFILFYLFIGLVAFKTMPDSATTYLIATTIAFFFIAGSFSYDEQNKTYMVINSLPIKRNSLIISKYISVLIYTLLSLLIIYIFTLIVFTLKLPYKIELLNLNHVFNVFIASMFLSSILLPIYCKFGYTKARVFTTLSYLLVFIAFNILGNIGTSIPMLLQGIKFGNLGLLILMSLIFILSMFLSIKLYENREF
ncbi:ABC-2 transporter permease [Clostridium malenominatum]|uniref:ABC-2 transporter permease n=1 Tax=Clostridium malenominatum TaxID=1539 RepID=A0ABP3UEW5_9CLOT